MVADAHIAETFLYREAELLDNKALDAWLELLTEDILYWMPLKRSQTEAEVHNSLFHEDLLLLRVRVARLKSPQVFSQQPPSYCQHVLQRPQIITEDSGSIHTRMPFFYTETQLDEQFVLSGVAYHELVHAGDALRIRRKRIELVNREAAFPSIQLLL